MKALVLKAGSILLLLCFLSAALVGCDDSPMPEGIRVAVILSSVGTDDHSYNYTVYNSALAFCRQHDLPMRQYRVVEDTTDAFLAAIDAAVNDDYSVLIVNSTTGGRAVRIASQANPDIKLIGIDMEQATLGGKDYVLKENTSCLAFCEQYAGFLAGYAAVKEGYRHLGFLGGVAVDAVKRFGYGYLYGIDAAAKEENADVTVEYVYGNQFFGDADITAYMDNWYRNKKVEAVFCCGGKIWISAATTAKETGGKVIGVDIDQSEEINAYAGGSVTLTNAVKGLGAAVDMVLTEILNDNWQAIGGQFLLLGMTDADDPAKNYLQLPMETWAMQNFTVEDYKALVADIVNGRIYVEQDISSFPALSVQVNDCGSIK